MMEYVTAWTLKRSEFRRQSHMRKGADGFWYVAVTWGNGRQERLGPYKTEAVAQERIKAQLDAWHDGQNKFRKT